MNMASDRLRASNSVDGQLMAYTTTSRALTTYERG